MAVRGRDPAAACLPVHQSRRSPGRGPLAVPCLRLPPATHPPLAPFSPFLPNSGKTLQTISLISYLTLEQRIKRPHLVVVPLSVLGNWMREVGHWAPQMKTLKLHGNKDVRAAMHVTTHASTHRPRPPSALSLALAL